MLQLSKYEDRSSSVNEAIMFQKAILFTVDKILKQRDWETHVIYF